MGYGDVEAVYVCVSRMLWLQSFVFCDSLSQRHTTAIGQTIIIWFFKILFMKVWVEFSEHLKSEWCNGVKWGPFLIWIMYKSTVLDLHRDPQANVLLVSLLFCISQILVSATYFIVDSCLFYCTIKSCLSLLLPLCMCSSPSI